LVPFYAISGGFRERWAEKLGSGQNTMSPDELKSRIPGGLLSFPLTDFDASDAFDAKASAQRLEWLLGYKSSAMFMAGGAGEFFSLTADEYSAVIRTAVATSQKRLPVIGAAGFGTRQAIWYAQETERLGADGILLLPPYLVEGPQEGLRAHITAICRATKLGVIVYNRANCRLQAETLARIADDCPNLIGFKDGVGDVEQIVAVRRLLGDRVIMLNGMPTAETYARPFRALGMATYSSAIFNFVPRTALAFHLAVETQDNATIDRLTNDFIEPYIRIRRKGPGYAVAIVKAGVDIIGRSAGKVRPPLASLRPDEYNELKALIETLGPQD
jgi:5-dehydro-4-deoxyglucarate dehydratase